MSLKKEGIIYCDQCGKELDHKIVCSSCGIMYPDFFLVQCARPPRRQVEKPDLFSLGFTLKPARPTYSYTYANTTESNVSRPPRPYWKLAGMAALVILIAVGIGSFYNKKKTEQIYAKNYIRALYAIKSGTDLSFNICAKISNDWKMTGQIPKSPNMEADESRLSSIKATTDRFIQKLNNPPKNFIGSKEKLSKLYDVYVQVNGLAVAPSGSLTGFTSSANKSQSDFNVAVQELKRSLPPELSAELQLAKTKYKGLKDI